MDCNGIREAGYEYARGWAAPRQAQGVEAHLAACASCAAEISSIRSTLALLATLPELEASPETWKKIDSQIAPRRAAPFRFWIRITAAASVLAAVVSFAAIFARSPSKAFPVVAENGKTLAWNQPFRAEKFTTLILPDVGTLKLNQNAVLRFADPRHAVLESGQVFADIIPSGRGFEILSGETRVRVQGTRFGVNAPSTVYVIEGRVEVVSPERRLELGADQVAIGSALARLDADDCARWLVEVERPAVRLKLDPGNRTTILTGAPLPWQLTLETDSLAPLYLGSIRDISQFLSLNINGHFVSLDPSRTDVRAARAANGMVRLDVSHPCVIECAVDPALFRDKGPAAVRAVFTSGTNAPEKAWIGIVQSEPVTVEVR